MAGRSTSTAAGNAGASVVYDVGSWRLGDDGAIYRRGRLKYANGDVYDGEWLNSKRHGHGTLTFAGASEGVSSIASSGSYVGGFADNLFDGFGVLSVARQQHALTKQWRPSERYEGDFVRGKRHGRGTVRTRDGDCYTGAFADGVYHGRGVCVYANGDAYDGAWVHGQQQGHGELRLRDGSTYVGAFHQGAFHGVGRLLLGRGGRLGSYVGDFVCGKRHGRGVRVFGASSCDSDSSSGRANSSSNSKTDTNRQQQRKQYDGEWIDDEPHGVGVVTCASYTLAARFVCGQASGTGTMVFANGERYDGAFVDGHFHGAGVFAYRDGGVYDGAWVSGKRHGVGRRVFANGDEYVGDWADDRMHGRGRFTSTRELLHGACGVQVYDGAFACGAQTGDAVISYTVTANSNKNSNKNSNNNNNNNNNNNKNSSSADTTDMNARFVWTREYEFPLQSGCWHCGRGTSTYVGSVLRGALHGTGELRSPDGKLWRGKWANGQLSGVGERVYLPLAFAAVLEREKDAAMTRRQQSQLPLKSTSHVASSNGQRGDSGGAQLADSNNSNKGNSSNNNGYNSNGNNNNGNKNKNNNNSNKIANVFAATTTKLYRIVQYEGEFVDGVRHGVGKLLYENGDRVIGRFVNGAAHGVVAYRFGSSGRHRLAELQHGHRVRWLEEQSEESMAHWLGETGVAAATVRSTTTMTTTPSTVLEAFTNAAATRSDVRALGA